MAVAPPLSTRQGRSPAPGSGPLGHAYAAYRAFEGRPHGPVMATV
jgi:hypothetical protein